VAEQRGRYEDNEDGFAEAMSGEEGATVQSGRNHASTKSETEYEVELIGQTLPILSGRFGITLSQAR